MLLGRFMCWMTIVTELAVVPAILIPRLQYWAVCANILFQSGLLLFTGTTFTLFFYSMTAASLAFVAWPEGPVKAAYAADCAVLKRITNVLRFCDADRRFSWNPLPAGGEEWLRLNAGKRMYTNFRALRMIVLLNPLTYMAIAALIAAAPDTAATATYRRIVVASSLFFLMPPLAWILDKVFAARQHEPLLVLDPPG
jgi:hypothetical protein